MIIRSGFYGGMYCPTSVDGYRSGMEIASSGAKVDREVLSPEEIEWT